MDSITNDEIHKARIEKTTKSKVLTHASTIINKHFAEAIIDKEAEIDAIDTSILEAQKALHLLRYGSVTRTYTNFTGISSTSMESLHPATKALVVGKRPANHQSLQLENSNLIQNTQPEEDIKSSKRENYPDESSTNSQPLSQHNIKSEPLSIVNECNSGSSTSTSITTSLATSSESTAISELPGYVGPSASNIEVDAADSAREPRGHQHKLKRRFVIGNVSKWIECNQREDSSTHKWMLYVRGCKKFPDISDVVAKVRFFIHQTYAPNNVIDVVHPPYHLIRRGWGEFPARVQIHFKGPSGVNKPVDVMHFIKLDKTYTGLQTLGAETLVDIWLQEMNMDGHEERGSISTTPNSTRPNSPFEDTTIPAAVEHISSPDEDNENSTENTELDVGKDMESIDTVDLHDCDAEKNLQPESFPGKNIEDTEQTNESCTINEDYSVPNKVAKVDESDKAVFSSSNMSQNTSAKVKPGTSLLLKRK